MEKTEARVKCSGCGTHYKLKFPVTDKPIRFQCKKCGKVLTLRIKPPAQTAPIQPTHPQPAPQVMPQLETTQLQDWEGSDESPAQGGLYQTKAADATPTPSQSVTSED